MGEVLRPASAGRLFHPCNHDKVNPMSDQNQNPTPADPQKEPPKTKGKKARVLVACEIGGKKYAANDIDVFDDATLKSHAGELDADPSAVKYAESQRAPAAES